MITTRGKMVELTAYLSRIVHSENTWSNVHSRTMWDGRCKIVLEQITEELADECYALILTLTEDGDLATF